MHVMGINKYINVHYIFINNVAFQSTVIKINEYITGFKKKLHPKQLSLNPFSAI